MKPQIVRSDEEQKRLEAIDEATGAINDVASSLDFLAHVLLNLDDAQAGLGNLIEILKDRAFAAGELLRKAGGGAA